MSDGVRASIGLTRCLPAVERSTAEAIERLDFEAFTPKPYPAF